MIYAEIPGYPRYRVGEDGSVWSSCYGDWRKLRQAAHPAGYRVVTLYTGKEKGRQHLVHHLVLLSFVGPCPEGMEACHFPNRNRTDNRRSNLRWDTPVANWHDRVFHGTANAGEKSPLSKLKNEQVRWVRRISRTGKYSQQQIADRLGVSRGCVRGILSGSNWKHLLPAHKGES